ncbi:MAG: DUF2975 domain-containing protein [Paludibacteraceae bacterium]|nr:DUF2975 domain-containing protein [Paludibacteraceae bacterium]
MKKFKVLCIILLTAFILSLFNDLVSSIISGFNLGSSSSEFILNSEDDYASYLYMDVDVTPDYKKAEFVNETNNNKLVVLPNTVTIVDLWVKQEDSSFSVKFLHWALFIINIVSVIVYISIVVLFIMVMRIFIKSEVFNRRVVKLLHLIGWSFIVLGIFSSLWNLLRVFMISSLVSMEGLEFTYRYIVEWSTILMGLVVLVNTEILSQATTIKDENDLTI